MVTTLSCVIDFRVTCVRKEQLKSCSEYNGYFEKCGGCSKERLIQELRKSSRTMADIARAEAVVINSRECDSGDIKMEEALALKPNKKEETELKDSMEKGSKLQCFRCFRSGLLYGFAVGVFFTLARACPKFVPQLHPTQVITYSAPISFLFAVGYSKLRKESLRPAKGEYLYLVLRAVSGGLNMVLLFASLKYLPLGDVAAVSSAQTPFVAVVACLLFREDCGPYLVVVISLVVFGIFLVSRPKFMFPSDTDQADTSSDRLVGMLFVIGHIVATSVAFLLCRKLQKTTTAANVAATTFAVLIGGLCFLQAIGHLRPAVSALEISLICVAGLCLALGSACLAIAMKLEQAALVTLMVNTQVFLNFAVQIAVFHHIPTWTSVIGAVLILAGVMMVLLRKMTKQQDVDCVGALRRKTSRNKHSSTDEENLEKHATHIPKIIVTPACK